MVAFVRYGDRAGLRAPVPTCPGWKVRHLTAHQGMVHRWATAQLQGQAVDPVAIERIGMNAEDPLDWLREGALDLVKAIMQSRSAPQEGGRMPPGEPWAAPALSAHEAWARHQCHETAIHAADALAASLGRAPVAAEVEWVDEVLALDGIDALLTRLAEREPMAAAPARRYLVRPDGNEQGWLLEVGHQGNRVDRMAGQALASVIEEHAPAVLSGSAVDVYLTLWNRSRDPLPAGWDDWPEQCHLRWDSPAGLSATSRH